MIDAERKIQELAPALHSELLAAKLREYGRFGLPGASSSDGRGGEPPLPLLGNTDRAVLRDRNLAEEYLSDAAVALDRYQRLWNSWCVPRTDDTEKAEALKEDTPKGAGECANIWCETVCNGIGNDRLRHGRCRACYRVFKLEGKDRDPRKDQVAS